MADNKNFNDILDQCLESLLITGGTVELCLEQFPAQADELRPLLETFIAGREAVEIQPSPEFRDKARNQLQAAFQDIKTEKNQSFFSFNWLKQPQWATAAIALVILIAGGGAVTAAGGSMPGQALYPVKIVSEQVQLALTFSTLGKAELHAQLADKRVTEIVYLADNNRPGEIADTAESLNTHLDQIVVLSSGKEVASLATAPMPAPMVEEAAPAAGVAELADTKEVQPEVAQDGAMDDSAETEEAAPPQLALTSETADVPEMAVTSEETLPVGRGGGIDTESGVSDDPWQILLRSVAEKAGMNLERLRALLDTVPESARPALLRAIAASEEVYFRAIESLR